MKSAAIAHQHRLALASAAVPVRAIEVAGLTRYLYDLEGQRYNVIMRGLRFIRVENEIRYPDDKFRKPTWRAMGITGAGIADELHKATLAAIERSKDNGNQENHGS